MVINQKDFSTIIIYLDKLTHNQVCLLRDRTDDVIHKNSTTKLIDQCKVENVIACPHCGSENVRKWGMASGLQRYRSKENKCTKTFNALTKTPLARLREKELWLKQIECLTDSKTIRQSARELGVAETTAFRWRHRFLSAPTVKKVSEVTGIVEAPQ